MDSAAPIRSAPYAHTATKGKDASVWPESPDARPLIPPGEYKGEVLNYAIHDIYQFPGKQTLVLQIRVFHRESDSVVLPRFLNYYKKPGIGSDYYKEWVAVNGKLPSRSDRMSPTAFAGEMVIVRVRTVNKDKDGDTYIPDLCYSVVGKILGRFDRP